MTVELKKNVSQLANTLNGRFEKLLLSLDEAIIDAGHKTAKQRLIEDSEQNDARRELLKVEELANEKRELAATAENALLLQLEADFHQLLIPDLEIEFRDIKGIMEKTLKFDDNLGQLLDILYTEACSISRLVSCIEKVPWLGEALIRFVRQPKYRRVDSKGSPIILKTLRSTLSFIGIDSLRLLIPVLVAKQTMPLKSEFTPDLIKNMWLYTIGTGNIAKTLAPKHEIRPHFAFIIGLLSNIGRTAVANIYLRTFDQKLREQIMKAHKENNINQAHALASLSPSNKYITTLWKKHASNITAEVTKELKCRWMTFAIGFEDFAKIREVSIEHVVKLNLHPFARLLFTSQGYMQYRMLAKEKVIEKEEAMVYLRNFGIGSKDVSLITPISLTGIELHIAGVIDPEGQEE